MNPGQSQSNSQGFIFDPTGTQGSIAGTGNSDADAAAGHPVPNSNSETTAMEVDENMSFDNILYDIFMAREDWSQPMAETSINPNDLTCGMVDSLTLTNCKVLESIFDEDEKESDSQDETIDVSVRRHRRGGVRSSQSQDVIADSIVETKTFDG